LALDYGDIWAVLDFSGELGGVSHVDGQGVALLERIFNEYLTEWTWQKCQNRVLKLGLKLEL
jgi:hypothetical protein